MERGSIRDVAWQAGQVAIVDIDGTLVDSNYHHVIAWGRAFARSRIFVPSSTLHRHVGMGGDQFVPAVAGDERETAHGDEIRSAHDRLYLDTLDEIRAFPDAKPFLRGLTSLGLRVVLATSAKEAELERYLELLDADNLTDGWTSAADVDRTKPHPDLLHAAIERAGGAGPAFLVGDSTWDAVAAGNAGIPMLGVLTGGFCASELADAGAAAVFSSVGDLGSELAASVQLTG